jgi:preprotein translocase subunit SecA
VAAEVEAHVRQALSARQEKLLGRDGQITRDLAAAFERVTNQDDQTRLRLLGLMAQGTSTSFDARTHRQVRQVFTRLHYVYLAGEMLRNSDTEGLEDEVLEHLQNAQAAQRSAWGESERVRLGIAAGAPLQANLEGGDGKEARDAAEEIGHNIQNQIYRQVLLGSITELWVDYLTRVEALRISVGLEAYAQSDPLVKYKSQASELFQNLLGDIRSAVIGRIFLYQPRPAAVQAEGSPGAPARTEQVEAAETVSTQVQSPGKKRKRHRH